MSAIAFLEEYNRLVKKYGFCIYISRNYCTEVEIKRMSDNAWVCDLYENINNFEPMKTGELYDQEQD